MQYRFIESPVGSLLLAGKLHAGKTDVLHFVGFPEGKGKFFPEDHWREVDGSFTQAEDQLNEYFEGRRQVFELKLQPSGTPFQLQVLTALQEIPFGETRSYLEIARSIGRPKAVRAVGAANGRNPLPIVIPCHRVIGTNGSLTGFGGGLAAKAYLLGLERGGFSLTPPRI
ncbi:MAG: methylated-DNA--[protein]-cysteine S-methyltransferase [Pseudomonadales bacterium]|nr:methylated-DNA--[protein]-cysteine S-methyltransferase [Pseudomonadales bacterium]MBO6658184.1 methylated-DNA--[protein]-cysteine S-methyltransferase [Pseudomonadales bacterium]MBO6704042.1 methylated-DNA--[protein]-cysteine S-methyltransferase [Pseudomonadales bacterium]MBO7006690.1 methylated-DNA--[protein]-cysteine S-methyltransferase [Pseudomonadales bacterium]